MKIWISALLASLFCVAAHASNTPLEMQMDRTVDPSPICANRIGTYSGCNVIGYMSSSGVFTLPPSAALGVGLITASMLASGAAASNLAAGSVTGTMLASGAAIANLGFTPLGTLTGNVTTVGNAATIAANSVTNAKLATMAANTIKGNNTCSNYP